MIAIKVQCACGQRYSFDVEPVNGRMPYTVACPVCNADGTAAANAIIAQTLGSVAAAAPAAAPATTLRTSVPAQTPASPAAAAPRPAMASRSERSGGLSNANNWKWWYFVLAGVLIGAYSIWQAYDKHSIKPLGELFFSAFCIFIGIWDFKAKRRKKLQQSQPQ